MSSCIESFEENYKKVSFEEKHLKGGLIGIPWNKLSQKQGLKREELKLTKVEDINETKIIATFTSSTHEIKGPMALENNRWGDAERKVNHCYKTFRGRRV